MDPPNPFSSSTPSNQFTGRQAETCFGENQLSAGLISLLLLTTAHRTTFQRRTVRASTNCYIRFTLAMVRSLAFGSTPPDLSRAIHTCFRYGFGPEALNLATHGNSPVHYAKGTPSGIPAEAGIALRPLVGTRFQVLFHSPYRGSFHFSLTLLMRYRSSRST